jgi:L-ascorbate metabolism protein UlaG (beta-lactamase superfamily)
VQPRVAIPMHYNTFDVIRADPEAFRRHVAGRAQVEVLAPGQSHSVA